MDFDLPEQFSTEKLRELFDSAGQDPEEFFRYLNQVSSQLEPSVKELVVPVYVLWTIGYSVDDAVLFMRRGEPQN